MAEDLERLLAEYATSRDRRLRNRIVTEAGGIAHAVAARYSGRGVPDDDLVQVGMLALVGAVEAFDIERGVPFGGYATAVVEGRVKQWFRDGSWLVRVPRPARDRSTRVRSVVGELEQRLGRSPTVPEVAAEIDEPVDAVLEALEASAAYRVEPLDPVARPGEPAAGDTGFEDLVDRIDLEAAMAALPVAEGEVLRLVYVDGLTQREAAGRLGVSQMQVSRLQRRALGRLRARFGD